MKTIVYAIGTALALASATVSAQAGERQADRSHMAPKHERSIKNDRDSERMPVSLNRSMEAPGGFAATPDAAYQVDERWSGNDNQG